MPWLVLLALGVIALVVELSATRRAFFFFDDWDPLQRFGWSLDALLLPHVQQLSALPIALLKGLYELLGIDSMLPFRLATITLHLIAAGMVCFYARSRVKPWVCVAATLPLLILGYGSYELFISFQVNYAMAVAFAVGGLLLLPRVTGAARVGSSALFLLAVWSASAVVPFVLGAGVTCLLRSDRRRLWWIPLPALVSFASWYLAYRDRMGFVLPPELQETVTERIRDAPAFIARAFVGAAGALLGVGPVAAVTGTTPRVFDMDGPGSVGFDGGMVMAIAVAALLLTRMLGVPGGRIRDVPQFAGLLSASLIYWGALAMLRFFQTPIQSNYIWVGSVIVILLLVEAFAGVGLSRATQGAVVVVGIASFVFNWAQLERVAPIWTGIAENTRLAVTAVEVAGRAAWPSDAPISLIGPTAEQWRAVAGRYGPAGYATEQISSLSEQELQTLDAHLVSSMLRVVGGLRGTASDPPTVQSARGVQLRSQGRSCVRATRKKAGALLDVQVPAGGLAISATAGGQTTVALRRFARSFPLPSGQSPGSYVLLPDRAMTIRTRGPARPPFVARIGLGSTSASVCGLADAP